MNLNKTLGCQIGLSLKAKIKNIFLFAFFKYNANLFKQEKRKTFQKCQRRKLRYFLCKNLNSFDIIKQRKDLNNQTLSTEPK